MFPIGFFYACFMVAGKRIAAKQRKENAVFLGMESGDYVAIETYNLYNGEPMTLVMAEALVGLYLKADQECKEGDLLPFDKEKKQCPWRIIDHMKGTDR